MRRSRLTALLLAAALLGSLLPAQAAEVLPPEPTAVQEITEPAGETETPSGQEQTETPVEPEQPETPEEPEQTETPVEPEQPETPAEPEQAEPSADGEQPGDPAGAVENAETVGLPEQPVLDSITGGERILLRWKESTNAKSYAVLRRVGTEEWEVVGTTDQLSWEDTAAEAGVVYTYSVKACGEEGESDWDAKGLSSCLLRVPALHPPETDPTAVLSWDSVPGAQTYRIYRRMDSGSWSRVGDTKQTSWEDTGAGNGNSYTYTVRALRGSFISGYDRKGVSVRFLKTPKLGAPVIGSNIQLGWEKVENASGYIVYRKTAGQSWKRLVSTAKNSYIDTTAEVGTAYIYTVRAYRGDLLSGYSAAGVTACRMAAPAVKAAVSEGQIQVTWGTVKGAEQYLVYRKTSGAGWKRLSSVKGTSFTDQTAVEGTPYWYTVRAANKNGLSDYDRTGAKAVLSVKIPYPSAAGESGGIRVSWGKITGSSGYIVYRKSGSSGWKRLDTVTGTTYLDKAVDSGVIYTYTVRAKLGNELGDYDRTGASGFFLRTPAIKQAEDGKNEIRFSWRAVTGAKDYLVYRKVGTGGWTRIGITGETEFRDKDLKSGVTYTYTVRARNGGVLSGYLASGATAVARETRWDQLLTKYRNDAKTNQLVFVEYTGGSNAIVRMYRKSGGDWQEIVNCTGYVGKNGIDKVKEGDKRTPTGTFNLTSAFGIQSNPGAAMGYVKVTKNHYWCGDREYYNQLVDVSKINHTCHGEHLIDYVPHYNYGMFLDYNRENVYGKGAAIFLHCTGNNPYTAGCIAVSQDNMIKIIKNAAPGAKICIYSK